MSEVLIAFVAGGSLTAIISGVFGIILYKIKKKDQQQAEAEAEDNVTNKALRYIMLYIIQNRAEKYIAKEEITVDERRSLHKWHELYHNGLNGNGDADALMAAVNDLPLKI